MIATARINDRRSESLSKMYSSGGYLEDFNLVSHLITTFSNSSEERSSSVNPSWDIRSLASSKNGYLAKSSSPRTTCSVFLSPLTFLLELI